MYRIIVKNIYNTWLTLTSVNYFKITKNRWFDWVQASIKGPTLAAQLKFVFLRNYNLV